MDELRQNFDTEASDSIKHPSRYARNFLEYCCFRALSLSSQVTGHLGDKNFRRLTYDMMLAWEAPGAASQPLVMVRGLDLFIVKLVMKNCHQIKLMVTHACVNQFSCMHLYFCFYFVT